jgi:two-component system OmpR family sensor kinase
MFLSSLDGVPGRLPIRARVTLAFALAMAVLLGGVGTFIYERQGRQTDHSINQSLRLRSDDLRAIVRDAGPALAGSEKSPLPERAESFAQILTPGGRILDASKDFAHTVALTPSQVRRAADHAITVERTGLPPDSRDHEAAAARMIATPGTARGRPVIVVVGTSLEARSDSQNSLAALLLLGGGVALALASAAGYFVVRASLAPIEAMRRRAATLEAEQAGARLPLPRADDEVHRLGETLNAMLSRLESARAHERRFVADASHELRTPLAILKGELELAIKTGHSVEPLRAAITSAAEETDRVIALAEDLLVLARADEGELQVRPERVSAAELLDVTAERFRSRAAEHGVELTVDAPPELALEADGRRLEQALSNMVDNALRHGAGPVTLRAVPENGSVAFHVLDVGEGFPDAFVDRAFERFSRADRARSRGGSGLGLTIVEAIAGAHGGHAEAHTRASGGADVSIRIPRASPPAD